ncbi:carbamoyltransferase HypF [Gemmatimonadota bacterium]
MTANTPVGSHVAFAVSVTGVVQGVGFRPFVHRMASEHRLCGWVRNEAGEVRIVVEGPNDAVETFLGNLLSNGPPLARIDTLEKRPLDPTYPRDFQIVVSADSPDCRSPVSPDIALCAACNAELHEPDNKRFRYPFITCTDCGPRFTVIHAMPYDRERTSMREFEQCLSCRAEYDTPDDRRFHSESNSCPDCGPSVWLVKAGRTSTVYRGHEAIEDAADKLRVGDIIAVRGLGGFHLAVDATNQMAVKRLRERKNRESKPLALMVQTLDDAMAIADIGETEKNLLTSPERPIVLLMPKEGTSIAAAVAPGLDTIGLTIAYTPLHHLLLEFVERPLVMTSGNMSEEPIATDNADAVKRLNGVADAFLFHDREIVARYDDSVVRVVDDKPMFLRRARGYAPLPLDLPIPAPKPLVAVGSHLKNTFTLVHGNKAYVSQHIGDLENLETLDHFKQSLETYKRLFRIEPNAVVRDLHPEYLSTRVADEMDLDVRFSVQHHHAHIAAVAAEHGVTKRVIGFAFDGTGYGEDGNVWGAETLVADLTGYERRCQLRNAPLPGGNLAVRQPWRAALGYLSLEPSVDAAFKRAFEQVNLQECEIAGQQITSDLNAPLASSMGRLFDAAAAVLGVRGVSFYEGQAAMELEALAGARKAAALPFPIVEVSDGPLVLDPLPLLVALGELRDAGKDVGDLAAAFHESVSEATAEVAGRVSGETGIRTVALGGGVFQNARLLVTLQSRLKSKLLTVLVPRLLSPNDGAISYGQAAVAAARMRAEVHSSGT